MFGLLQIVIQKSLSFQLDETYSRLKVTPIYGRASFSIFKSQLSIDDAYSSADNKTTYSRGLIHSSIEGNEYHIKQCMQTTTLLLRLKKQL